MVAKIQKMVTIKKAMNYKCRKQRRAGMKIKANIRTLCSVALLTDSKSSHRTRRNKFSFTKMASTDYSLTEVLICIQGHST